jgi:hypothetical protein
VIQEIQDLLKRIRTMEGRLQDPKYWQVVHTRADQLSRMLDGFSG